MNRETAIADLLRCGAIEKTVECGFWQPSQYEKADGKRYYELQIDGSRKLGFMFNYAVYSDVWLRLSSSRSYNIGISGIPIILRYYGFGSDYMISANHNLILYATPVGIALGVTFNSKEEKFLIAENGKKNQLKSFRESCWVLSSSWDKRIKTAKRKYIITSKDSNNNQDLPSSKYFYSENWWLCRDDENIYIESNHQSKIISDNKTISNEIGNWLTETLSKIQNNTVWKSKFSI